LVCIMSPITFFVQLLPAHLFHFIRLLL
jgi:hypothetical protein